MEAFLYTIIFIIGTFFGSFFTLAVYRLPRKEDILIKHSYCPNCEHKLGFFDLFPILSYIFLKGKCRYCGNKIRIRYLILELLSGLTFLVLSRGVKIDILNIKSIINVIFLLLYVSILFIIAGIDKENIMIQNNVLTVGYIIEVLYIIYQYTLEKFNVHQYVIYLAVFIITFLIIKLCIKKHETKHYFIQNLLLSFFMIIYSGLKIYILSLISATIVMQICKLLSKKKEKIQIGFYLSICNISIIAVSNIIINYII